VSDQDELCHRNDAAVFDFLVDVLLLKFDIDLGIELVDNF